MIDDIDNPPQEVTPPRKRRGRPPGSRSTTFRDVRAIGLHHFAFLRSDFLGIDIRAAFARYLEWSETTSDLRHIENRKNEILRHIIDAGTHLDATLPEDEKITPLISLLRNGKKSHVVSILPTLDEWLDAENLRDFYTESEAYSEYQAAFGLDNPDEIEQAGKVSDLGKERVNALNRLSMLLAATPSPTDKIDAWFAAPVVKCLHDAGVITLSDLVKLISVYGFRWHHQVKGFGIARAKNTVSWLRSQSDVPQFLISDTVDEPKSKRALFLGLQSRQLVQAIRFGVVPLEYLSLPMALSGADGTFRSHAPNTLEADNDIDAIKGWLSRHAEHSHTGKSYRKDVERFLLWITTVQRKALSSASSLDCQAYRSFLAAIPWSWINPVPVARLDPLWRPFRGQLSPASQKQALVIVQTLFEGLRDAGYLVANPMRQVMKAFSLPASKINLSRAFSEDEWRHILNCIDLEDGPSKLRLRCTLELLVSSGIRLDELAKARHSDLRMECLPDHPASWILTVKGKGNKPREVPLSDYVVDLLLEHAQEFAASDEDLSKRPLLCSVGTSVSKWTVDASGAVAAIQTRPAETGQALSAAGIYASIKRFFGRAASTAADAKLDPTRFARASTHWMRHTWMRQGLVDGVPVEVMSELAGHASIATTSIYSTQELARKIAAIKSMKRRVRSPQ